MLLSSQPLLPMLLLLLLLLASLHIGQSLISFAPLRSSSPLRSLVDDRRTAAAAAAVVRRCSSKLTSSPPSICDDERHEDECEQRRRRHHHYHHQFSDCKRSSSSIISRREVISLSLTSTIWLSFSPQRANAQPASSSSEGGTITASPATTTASDKPPQQRLGLRGGGMPIPSKKLGGLASKIRSVVKIMDELQRDLMQERWDLVAAYPSQLRSYVPVFTSYTDSAFPSPDLPTDRGLRVALRYEVGRFFAACERLASAVGRRELDEAYVAYSDMALHLDRYLRVGGLYTYYDDSVSLEPYYDGVPDSTLVYADPKRDPALVRDLIVLIRGPDKGRTGIVIGLYSDGSDKAAVKLDRYRGMREIRIVPRAWAAKRLGEQDPDDVFLIPQMQ